MFAPALFASFRSGYSLGSQVVSAKVYPLITEKALSWYRNSSCETGFNVQETDTFQNFVIKEVYKSNHNSIVIVDVLFTLFLANHIT